MAGKRPGEGSTLMDLAAQPFLMSEVGGFCDGFVDRLDQLITRKFEQKKWLVADLFHSGWPLGVSGLSFQTMGLEAPKAGT